MKLPESDTQTQLQTAPRFPYQDVPFQEAPESGNDAGLEFHLPDWNVYSQQQYFKRRSQYCFSFHVLSLWCLRPYEHNGQICSESRQVSASVLV